MSAVPGRSQASSHRSAEHVGSPVGGESFRPLTFGLSRAHLRAGEGGHQYLRSDADLLPFPQRLTDRLRHWAQVQPEKTWMARRRNVAGAGGQSVLGEWQHVSYAQAWTRARRIAQCLLQRNLSAERPVLILSENSRLCRISRGGAC